MNNYASIQHEIEEELPEIVEATGINSGIKAFSTASGGLQI
ncbi:MAG: hypothetical protein QXZ44_00645 [Ferroplasma sp.]